MPYEKIRRFNSTDIDSSRSQVPHGLEAALTPIRKHKLQYRKIFLKQSRLHKITHRNFGLLLDLYGLEISECTGNARRVSLIDILFTSPLKGLFISFPWKTTFVRKVITGIVNDKAAEELVKVYTKNPAWQENIKDAVTFCLEILELTGIDNQGKISALCHGRESLTIVEFPKDLYSWGNIFNGKAKSVTVAVITDTCLSLRFTLREKRCTNGGPDDEGSIVLATHISILPQMDTSESLTSQTTIGRRTPKSPLKGFSLSTNESGENYWAIQSTAADQQLSLATMGGDQEAGYLEIIEPITDERDGGFGEALISKWTRGRIPGWAKLRPGGSSEVAFVECLVSSGNSNRARPITTYIIADVPNKLSILKGIKDE